MTSAWILVWWLLVAGNLTSGSAGNLEHKVCDRMRGALLASVVNEKGTGWAQCWPQYDSTQ